MQHSGWFFGELRDKAQVLLRSVVWRRQFNRRNDVSILFLKHNARLFNVAYQRALFTITLFTVVANATIIHYSCIISYKANEANIQANRRLQPPAQHCADVAFHTNMDKYVEMKQSQLYLFASALSFKGGVAYMKEELNVEN